MSLRAVCDAAWLVLSDRAAAEALADRSATLLVALQAEKVPDGFELPSVAGRLQELSDALQGAEPAASGDVIVEAVLRRAG